MAQARRPAGLRQAVLAATAYQALALAAWWRLLSGGLTSTLPSGSADPGQEVWFLGWLPHAAGAGLSPFFSSAIFAPKGVNLLANTSMPLLGALLSPVTVLFGPVASFDLAVLVAPAASALAMWWALGRFAAWGGARFAGGLAYGFGPFLATDLRYGHLNLTFLPLLPVLLALLYDVFVREEPPPRARTGLLVGLAGVGELLVSTEMFAIAAVTAAVGLALLALAQPAAARASVRRALPAAAAAAAVGAVALSYPVYAVTAGARHVDGPVWRHTGALAATLASAVLPRFELARVAFVSGGDGSYLGVALLAVLAGGVLVWRHHGALRFAAAMLVVSYVLSLGYSLHATRADSGVPLPAALLAHLPLLGSLIPERFGAVTDLFAAMALGIVVDLVHAGEPPGRLRRLAARAFPGPRARALLAGGLALGALVPLALEAPWPYPVRRLQAPPAPTSAWLASGGSDTPPVVAMYPVTPEAQSEEMVWQASCGYCFTMDDGYAIVPGRRGRATQSPRQDALWLDFAAGSLGRLAGATPGTAVALRRALFAAAVTEVVVLPGRTGSRRISALLDAALGPPARVVAGVGVWEVSRRDLRRALRRADALSWLAGSFRHTMYRVAP